MASIDGMQQANTVKMNVRGHDSTFTWVRRTFFCCLITIVLAGCGLGIDLPFAPASTATPTPAPATSTPTVTPTPEPTLTPTATPTPTPTPLPPTPTPNTLLVPETYSHETNLFSVQHPPEWEIQEQSEQDEILVSLRTPSDAPAAARALVNVFNVGAQLDADELPALADTYLRNLLQELYDVVERTPFEHEGETLVTTIRTPVENPNEQVHLEVRFRAEGPLFAVVVGESAEARWADVAPTLQSLARSLVLTPAQADVLATPVPAAEEPVEALQFRNANSYRAQTDSLYVVGDVENTGDQSYQDVLVTVALLDADGSELTRETWPLVAPILRSGDSVPFAAIFDTPPETWASIDTTITARTADDTVRLAEGVRITDTVGDDPVFGAYRISGEVVNTDETPAASITVIGALYDEEGHVLGVEVAALAETLAAGERVHFELLFPATAEGEVARERVLVYGLLTEPPASVSESQ